jgi:hypothetical protein
MDPEDLIKNEGPKVLAQIVVSLVEIAPGQTGTKVEQNCPDEITSRGLYDKGGEILRLQWQQQAAPRVVPGNGLAHLPDGLKKYFNRG